MKIIKGNLIIGIFLICSCNIFNFKKDVDDKLISKYYWKEFKNFIVINNETTDIYLNDTVLLSFGKDNSYCEKQINESSFFCDKFWNYNEKENIILLFKDDSCTDTVITYKIRELSEDLLILVESNFLNNGNYRYFYPLKK